MATKRFVDANVLLRYLLRDDKRLHEEARGFLEDSTEKSLILTAVIAAEVIYILLQKNYSRQQVADLLQFIMDLRSVETEDSEAMSRAVQSYAKYNLDFADCYILERSFKLGYGLATQDNKLRKTFAQRGA